MIQPVHKRISITVLAAVVAIVIGSMAITQDAVKQKKSSTRRGDKSNSRPSMIVVLPNGGHSTFYKDSFDGRLPTVRDFHQALVEHNVDHTYIELEGLAHRRTEMIERLRPIWFDYHVESLRRAALENDESLGK